MGECLFGVSYSLDGTARTELFDDMPAALEALAELRVTPGVTDIKRFMGCEHSGEPISECSCSACLPPGSSDT